MSYEDHDDPPLIAPPHDVVAEMAVLGSMLLSREAIEVVRATLTASDFYVLSHQVIFRSMLAIADRGAGVDVVLLRAELNRAKSLTDVGGTRYLQELMEAVITSANAPYYASIVQQQAALRAILQLGFVARSASAPGADVETLIATIQTQLGQSRPSAQTVPHASVFCDEANEWAEKRRAGEQTALPTGIGAFDRTYGGLEPGEFAVICAQQSVGKTALLANILLHVAVRKQIPALFFSAEVAGRTLMIDMRRTLTGIDYWDIRHGALSASHYAKWKEGDDLMRAGFLYVDETPRIFIEDLCQRAAQAVRDFKVRMVAVDYLQVLRTRESFRGQYNLQIAHISAELKRIAGELKVPVLLLSQITITEDGMRRTRWSDETAHHADYLIFLEPPKEYVKNPENEPPDTTRKFIVAKGRHKGVGYKELGFNKPILRFYDLEKKDGDGNRDGAGEYATAEPGAGGNDRPAPGPRGKERQTSLADRARSLVGGSPPDGAAEDGFNETLDVPEDTIPF